MREGGRIEGRKKETPSLTPPARPPARPLLSRPFLSLFSISPPSLSLLPHISLPLPLGGRCFRFKGTHRLRPVCRPRCSAMRCYSQAQGEGPLQLKYKSQPSTATHIVLNIGPVSAFWRCQRFPSLPSSLPLLPTISLSLPLGGWQREGEGGNEGMRECVGENER